jgi:hypothetical protein
LAGCVEESFVVSRVQPSFAGPTLRGLLDAFNRVVW